MQMDLSRLASADLLSHSIADVAASRERARRRRLTWLSLVLAGPFAILVLHAAGGHPVSWHIPALPIPDRYAPGIFLTACLAVVLLLPMRGGGRSPHVLYQPSEIPIGFSDVKGAGPVVDEVVRTLNLFLAHRTFAEGMGGNPRRAILFEGPPGTGKTHMAKAMAREAGVPFLFVSSSAFQSMFYGQTNRKIRSYFKALRSYARREGGAIGFIEEIDAIGAARAGSGSSTYREGVAGVVNELLVQLQSFDVPSSSRRVQGFCIDVLNRWLPAHRQLRKKPGVTPNVLVIGATNRAADLDPALLRPGRFDRTIRFDVPTRAGRLELIDYFLARKAHDPALDARREEIAGQTFGYSPVMIEHVFDEALVWALRGGREAFNWDDLQQARMTEELGLRQPVEYTEAERRMIATHEAGHATVAHLVGKGRRLEVLSVVKRGDALGLLAHSETEERFIRTREESEAILQIAFGGLAAEETFFGSVGSGVAGDLQAASAIAAQLVGALGQGGSLLSLEGAGPPGANLLTKALTMDHTREAMEEVLGEARATATSLVQSHHWLVEALRDALLERDELVGDEITDVIERATKAHADTAGRRPSPTPERIAGSG